MISNNKTFRKQKNGTHRIYTVIAAVLFIFILLHRALFAALGIIFGAAVVSFLVVPLARLYERRLQRPSAALLALLSMMAIALITLWLLLPALISEANAVIHALPESLAQINTWISETAGWFKDSFPGIGPLPLSLGQDRLPEIVRSTANFAGTIADGFYHLSLMVVLGYFFLCDRKRLLIRLELLIPSRFRQTAVITGTSVCRELKNYLRGQGLISAIVGLVSAAGLFIVGVRSSLILGSLVGLMNMIPYFGPVLGAIPAVLMALSDGWKRALYAAIVLWLVQQLDSTLISPRVMSSVSGVSPAVVLLAVFAGSALGGIAGMLFAMPVVMSIRTVFRVFVQKYENV